VTSDPAPLAVLHARAFVVPRPWAEAEFAALLGDPGVGVLVEPPGGFTPPGPPVGYFQTENEGVAGAGAADLAGFLVFRVVLDEAELLTLAVEPGVQGRGIGGRLVARFLAAAAARGAVRAFLEVAADNVPARAVYGRAGFAEVGRRRGYYVTQGQGRVDAVVMARDLHGF
jgi:[ribosomal protein S18]-alanine N-acetyltransferase